MGLNRVNNGNHEAARTSRKLKLVKVILCQQLNCRLDLLNPLVNNEDENNMSCQAHSNMTQSRLDPKQQSADGAQCYSFDDQSKSSYGHPNQQIMNSFLQKKRKQSLNQLW